MYISPVDLLDISLEELENINEKNIIRLEKRLKILKLQQQEDFHNIEELYLLIDQLKDIEKRKVIIFIEKHPAFKEFISSGKNDGPRTFFFENEFSNKLSTFSSFLTPYLKAYFVPLLKKDYQNKKYDTIIEALKNKDLFTDEILLECYNYLNQQTSILTEIIRVTKAKQLYKKCPQVTYKTHILLLNLIPISIIKDTKIDYVNALVDYHNKTQVNNHEYNKIKNAYRLFSSIETEDEYVDEQIKKLSYLGYKENNLNDPEEDNSGFIVIKAIAFILAIVFGIAKIARSNNTTSNYNFDHNKEILKNQRSILKKYVEEKQVKFIKHLYDIAEEYKDPNFDKKTISLVSGKEPFLNFNALAHLKIKDSRNIIYKDSILINNSSNKSLILFLKYPIDNFKTAVFVQKKDSLKIKYDSSCEFIFYIGNDFSEFDGVQNPERFFNKITSKDRELLLKKYILNTKIDSVKKSVFIKNDTILFNNIKVDIIKKNIQKKISSLKTNSINNYTTQNTDGNIGEKIAYNLNWNKNKNLFLKKLNQEPSSGTKKVSNSILNGENPYPKYFRDRMHANINGYPVTVKNNTEKHLIILNRNLINYRDFATYIKANNETTIYLYDVGDSLYFYRGKSFYLSEKIMKLKMDSKDRVLFSKPLLIKNVSNNTPVINVNKSIVELSKLNFN